MKCDNCGKELTYCFALTEEEEREFIYAEEKVRTATSAMNPDVINKIKFENDAQFYAYMKAVYDTITEGNFLKNVWFKKFEKKYNIPKEKTVIFNAEVYKHP